MQNEKIENLLNLALEATPREREKSLQLEVGYDVTERTWEVIVKFVGTMEQLNRLLNENFPQDYDRITVTNLQNEYAILILPEQIVEAVASLPEIEYMEKPKRLSFAVDSGKRASCISPLQTDMGQGENVPTGETAVNRRNLSGRGVLVAVIDSGIDYAHPDFRNPDGTTRILALWDQTIPAGTVAAPGVTQPPAGTEQFPPEVLSPPAGYFLGTEFDREVINLALNQPTEALRNAICPSRDISGHGTHVAGIAAGNGRASDGRYRGVAYESDLLIVKLGTAREEGFPRTTELMQAVDYCIRKAEALKRPIALNLSFGNNYGSHSGTSLIETFLDDISNFGRSVIVTGSGNEGNTAVHTAGRMTLGQESVVELAVSSYETTVNVQIWKSYADEAAVTLVSPGGRSVGPIRSVQGAQRFTLEQTEILFYYGMPSPYSPFQEIYFELLPVGEYIDSGIWEIRLLPQRIALGNYNMWLPSGGVLNAGTGFLYPVDETTLTIPSTAAKVITVGAYDARFNQPAAFSGRGYTRETNQVKPDLVAPGVEITSCAPGGGYATRSGTSMATPFVTGSAALMMQWGIVGGNDSYLYGEKIKAYLIRGARPLGGIFAPDDGRERVGYPNPQLGWGTLCLADSLPG